MSTRDVALCMGIVLASMATPAGALAQTTSDEAHFAREGWYRDEQGRRVDFHDAYEAWASPDRYERHWVRSLAWAGALLGFGTAWYWLDVDFNRVDWDFPEIGDRLNFAAVRFDNNRYTTNNLLHPLAGTGYYGLARVNGLRVVESFLVSFFASALWEFAFEWREKVSINDQIFTPGSGVVLGEVLFQLGDYLNSAPGGGRWPQRAAQVTLGFPRFVHGLIDGPPPGPPPPADDLGFASSFWHRFHVAYEMDNVRNDTGDAGFVHAAVLRSELVSVPGYLRPGEIRLGFDNGNFTRLDARVGFDTRGLAELTLDADATLAGYLVQSLEPRPGGGLTGYSAMVGFDVAYSYAARWLLDRQDQWSSVHVAGPRVVARIPFGEGWLELDGRAHVDFTAARALAFDRWAAKNGTAGVKSILDLQGYYYGLGWSARLAAAYRIEGGFLEAELDYGHVDSVEGLDREQERITRDVSMDDDQLGYRVGIGVGPPTTPLELRVGSEGLYRWSAMGDVECYRWDRRWTASVGSRF